MIAKIPKKWIFVNKNGTIMIEAMIAKKCLAYF